MGPLDRSSREPVALMHVSIYYFISCNICRVMLLTSKPLVRSRLVCEPPALCPRGPTAADTWSAKTKTSAPGERRLCGDRLTDVDQLWVAHECSTTNHKIKKELSICQSLLCLAL